MYTKETRSKKLIECLSELGHSISYDKVMKIENDLGNAVAENISLNHGVFVPPNIQTGIPLHFAVNNIDFKNDHQTRNQSFMVLLLPFLKKTANSTMNC